MARDSAPLRALSPYLLSPPLLRECCAREGGALAWRACRNRALRRAVTRSSTTFEGPVPASEVHPITPPSTMADPTQRATMDRILQDISAVGRRLEGVDNAMTSLTAETKSMCLDIAGFQSRVSRLKQRVSLVETHITSSLDRDQELLYLRSKLIDLDNRSR
ncbi:hypothetical protein NDU88_003366 [Pleurodeles waltl]|uniref:Uncharacterized protein n=1 Tax=Pleurodeles waltl TaxID=8319 RepID=A0AAV7RCN5_PLEWA|nr:hypothetical protein NDU88_003366 [Pleurodeles waltl]